jgi:hypothetical protein
VNPKFAKNADVTAIQFFQEINVGVVETKNLEKR